MPVILNRRYYYDVSYLRIQVEDTWLTHLLQRPLNMLANNFTLCLMIAAAQRLVLDLRKVSSDDTLSTTRVGREVERAIEAMPRSREPSPIVFADRVVASPESTALRPLEHRIDVGRVGGWMSKEEEERRAREEGGLELNTLTGDDGGTRSKDLDARIVRVT